MITQKKAPLKVAVTGAAGQISYSLLFRLASGEVFGADTPIELHLIELPMAMQATEGVAMELWDCGYGALTDIQIFDSVEAGFDGVHWAVLVGSKPRQKGMQRRDLIRVNGPIFAEQGKALLKADDTVNCLVVGNPCNTNALIALSHAQDIPANRFYAMTALDENRAKYQIANKLQCSVVAVNNLIIWGNHSASMVPDYENAQVYGQALMEQFGDHEWLQTDFIESVQQRGMEIIKARSKSSAASAASACIDTLKHLYTPSSTPFSCAAYSTGNPYEINDGIVYSFPMVTTASGVTNIVSGYHHSEFLRQKMKVSQDELMVEKEAVADLIP
ncbi:MAG: malate dehydrogenase [Proteobacteria bacterium]|nr:malate dehydrogenase [Pseudomonadota bacterium]